MDATPPPPPPPWLASDERLPVPDVEHDEPGLERHSHPAVAVGDSVVLVAWGDERADPLSSHGSDVMVARYAADGTLLDPKGIRVATTGVDEGVPRVAYGKGQFLVTWWAITQSPNGFTGDGLVRAARVTPAGQVLDPQGLDVAANAGPPEVTFAGDRFLVTFGPNASGSLRVFAVSAGGVVQSEPTVAIPQHGFVPRLASGGSHTLLSYLHEPSVTNRSTRLLLFDEDGKTLKEHSQSVPIGFEAPVAGGPTGFITAVNDHGKGTGALRRMGADGGWTDSASIETSFVQRMVRDGDGYLVASWAGVFRLPDGSSTPGAPFAVPDDGGYYGPDLGSDSALRAATWTNNNSSEVWHSRLEPSGAMIDAPPKVVPRSRTAQTTPALAVLGSTPLLAWGEASLARKLVRFALLEADAEKPASPVQSIADARSAAVAAGPNLGLVVWESTTSGAIDAVLVTPDGAAGPVISISKGWEPRAVATPEGFVVSHTESTGVYYGPSLRAVSLDSDGKVTKSVDIGPGVVAVPVAVGAGAVFAVRAAQDLMPSDLRITTLSGGSTVIGRLAPAALPAVATDGARALVVWTDHESRRLLGAFVSGAALLGSPFPVSPPGHDALAPAATHDGDKFVVSWRDLRGPEFDLFAARITDAGVVVDLQGFPASEAPGNELGPALAAVQAGTLLAYSRFDSVRDATRVFTRVLTEP